MRAMLRTLYLDWRAAVARRSGRGELRAGNEEREALDRFLQELETLDEEQRAEWESVRATLDAPEAVCACGHPLAHHDEGGSCFHVIGCATGCACSRLDARKPPKAAVDLFTPP